MTNTTENSSEISLESAALELHTTPVRVLMLLKQKILDGRETNGSWRISRKSIEAYRESPQLLHPASSRHCKSGGCSGCGH